MRKHSDTLVKRTALAVIGQALPQVSALTAVLKDFRKAMMSAVIAGILVAALILLGAFGAYHFLLEEGLSNNLAIGMSAGLVALLAVIAWQAADRSLERVSHAKHKLGFFPERSSEPGYSDRVTVENLLEAFLAGVIHPETEVKTPQDEDYHSHSNYPRH